MGTLINLMYPVTLRTVSSLSEILNSHVNWNSRVRVSFLEELYKENMDSFPKNMHV